VSFLISFRVPVQPPPLHVLIIQFVTAGIVGINMVVRTWTNYVHCYSVWISHRHPSLLWLDLRCTTTTTILWSYYCIIIIMSCQIAGAFMAIAPQNESGVVNFKTHIFSRLITSLSNKCEHCDHSPLLQHSYERFSYETIIVIIWYSQLTRDSA